MNNKKTKKTLKDSCLNNDLDKQQNHFYCYKQGIIADKKTCDNCKYAK